MKKKKCKNDFNNMCRGGAIYGFGFAGAAIYYISAAPTFWAGVLGFLKAIAWPVFLVYGALKFMGA